MPNTMRAALLDAAGGPGSLRIGETPAPDRVNAEFLIKVVAAGVNPIDVKTRAGTGVFGAIRSFPAVLGYDFSGIVVESPFDAHPLRPGDEVFGMAMVPRFGGSYAEYVSAPSLSVVRKPATLSHIEAAAAPLAALTAWGMVIEVARAHEGQRMLIHAGSDGVGHFAVQFAAYFGATVIATASGANTAWLRSLGAAQVIDYTTMRFEEVVSDVDVVIDLVGNVLDDTGARSLGVLRPGGLIVNAPTGSWPGIAEDAAAAGVRGTGYRVAPDGSTLAVIARLLESGSVRVHVDAIYPLEQIAEAHRAVESGHTRGKVVVKVAEG
ncbi:NADPH:quinone reductase [Leifsonia xyli subsp. xyli]|uniref:Zinc-binding oxidoreductase n=2 Tax=Leifsonia xyli subsp. xyli TaxID=59736 RepID=Q6AH23_LEIXX|nr:NADP-dependent oxidoreductase [Leifsonia xyli]AAT88322.1 zinc-binding oxidoreductase [Leifsonia xyli subsp. xyli str. CTCB07]ODA89761.1 NADPH:quinone reductase [Leifsonia xyli subsp. xyli]